MSRIFIAAASNVLNHFPSANDPIQPLSQREGSLECRHTAAYILANLGGHFAEPHPYIALAFCMLHGASKNALA